MTGYEDQVRAYLADCRRAAAEMDARGSAMDPRYHPTADGACKLIPHGGDPAEAAKIRQAFRSALEPETGTGEAA